MKSFPDLLHKTPWWALLLTGMAALFALAAFVTPYHIIDYRNEGDTPAQRRAIKREIDNAFAENAIDIASNVLRGMKRSTKDPSRREELDTALEGLAEARNELREAGAQVMRTKREALESTRDAARAARDAIREARRHAQDAIDHGSTEEGERVKKALEQSLKATEDAERAATKSLEDPRGKHEITLSTSDDKPMIDIEMNGKKIVVPNPHKGAVPAPPAAPMAPMPPAPHDKVASAGIPPVPAIADVPKIPSVDAPPLPPLPPEFRDRIRENVTGDMYRIGIGAALALILIPMFILAIVAKFFIDRSRVATRMAELKRKEAEYARMGQQVTEAKLQALQAQVEPHFLYNTLASVQALTEVDPARANEMTGHLIQYLRSALPKMREGISTVGQEIELVRAYLSILQMRMGKRLTFDIVVPANLNGLAFPPLMLPSLVENAIKHGLEPQREGGSVHIRAQHADGKLRLIVADTGRGFGENIGAGVGLANIRERLAALYGDKAKLTLEENSPHGVIATLEVPGDGARAAAGAATGFAPRPVVEAPSASEPRTRTARTLSAIGTAERVWRKALSFTFMTLVIVAAVAAGLAIFGVSTGMMPIQMGDEVIGGPGGALVGTAGILLAFVVVVIAIAIVVAVVYGLGFLMVGLAIFIPMVVLIAMAPVLAPVVLAGLVIWWILRKKDRDRKEREAKVEPTMAAPMQASPAPAPAPASSPAAADMPPPVPPADRPL